MGLLYSLISLLAFSQAEAAADLSAFAGKNEMSGYRFEQFGEFYKTWHLVTVRFRKDTNEQRFVYANDIAWSALQEKSANFPDGAVFAKIGLITQEDPNFTASAVPSGARRYQFMVKDSAKHGATNGWGYALFNASGVTIAEDPKIQVIACHACHRLVPQFDYVFSRPMSLTANAPMAPVAAGSTVLGGGLTFKTIPVEQLPANVRNELPLKVKKVRSLTGELAKNLFPGTLDEIRPSLAIEALKAGMPALLLSEDKKFFSLVFEDKSSRSCSVADSKAKNMMSVFLVVVSVEKVGSAPISSLELQRLPFCRSP